MIAWLLLLLTLFCAYATYDSFRWRGSIERMPFSTIESMWKGGLPFLSAVERNQLRQRLGSMVFGVGQICWLFLVATIVLAIFTVRAFVA